MTTIVTRAGKGAPLTNVEVDANFTNLNNDKIEKTGGTITANSSSAALTITQTGSGNAFVVEDAASDTTPFVVDAGGRVISGNTVAISDSLSPPRVQLHAVTNFADSRYGAFNWEANTNSASIVFAKSRSTIPGTYAIASSGDLMGAINFEADDGVQFRRAAQITALVDGTPGTSSMPGRLAFSTTPSGSASPVERMRIDSSGRIGIGTLPTTEAALRIGTPLTGAAIQAGVRYSGTVNSDITTEARSFASVPSTQAASFTLPTLAHFLSAQGTIGAGSTITNQLGFKAEANLVSATNNYGFYGNIPAGTGRWNFYAAGTAQNYLAGTLAIGNSPSYTADAYGKLLVMGAQAATSSSTLALMTQDNAQGLRANLSFYSTFIGTADNGPRRAADILAGFTNAWSTEYLAFNVGVGAGGNDYRNVTTERMRIRGDGNVAIGSTGANNYSLIVNKNVTGATTAADIRAQGVIQSDVTTLAMGFTYQPITAASAFTCTYLQGFRYDGVFLGAGSAVTSQYGFIVESSTTGATNNYGFYGNIPAGTGRWNFYASGTAANYFAGDVGVGVVPTGFKLSVAQTAATHAVASLYNADATATYNTDLQINNGNVAGNALLSRRTNGEFWMYTSAAHPIAFWTNSVERMRIGSDGGVSIGTTASAGTNTLRVVNTVLATDRLEVNSQGTGNRYAHIDLIGDDTYTDFGARLIRDNAGANATTQLITRGTGDLTIKTIEAGAISLATSNVERMRIDASGSVGIGGTPDYKLDVFSGSIRVNGNARTVAGDASIYFGSTTSNYIYSGNSSNIMAFATNGAERMRIDSNGIINFNSLVSGYNWLSIGGRFFRRVGSTDAFEMVNKANTAVTHRFGDDGSLHLLQPGTLGYGTGAGGTVTQATSKYTAVTLNKPTGRITMNAASLAAGGSVEFRVNNSCCSIDDLVVVNKIWDAIPNANYRVELSGVGVSAFSVRVTNITAGELSEAVMINFAIIKGATA